MKILVTYAFDEEIIPFELQGVDITFLRTGMGKVLSAFNLTKAAHFNGDVVDMEAFAQAMVCKEMNVDFVSVKYITDIIGQNSGQIWLDKLRDAREALKEFFA